MIRFNCFQNENKKREILKFESVHSKKKRTVNQRFYLEYKDFANENE